MSTIDKRLENTVSAATLNFEDGNYINRVFRKVHNGELTVVRLTKVKRRDVYLDYVQGDRADGFTISHAEFRKFYHMVRTRQDDIVYDAAQSFVEGMITRANDRMQSGEYNPM